MRLPKYRIVEFSISLPPEFQMDECNALNCIAVLTELYKNDIFRVLLIPINCNCLLKSSCYLVHWLTAPPY
jgi:hypothetical protein